MKDTNSKQKFILKVNNLSRVLYTTEMHFRTGIAGLFFSFFFEDWGGFSEVCNEPLRNKTLLQGPRIALLLELGCGKSRTAAACHHFPPRILHCDESCFLATIFQNVSVDVTVMCLVCRSRSPPTPGNSTLGLS